MFFTSEKKFFYLWLILLVGVWYRRAVRPVLDTLITIRKKIFKLKCSSPVKKKFLFMVKPLSRSLIPQSGQTCIRLPNYH